MLIDGKKIALKIYDDLKKKASESEKKITLGAILVGKNESSIKYIKQKKKWADYVGINFVLKRLDDTITTKDLLNVINDFNVSEKITGFIIQLPLPEHIDEKTIIESISHLKDVDGFHPLNMGKLVIGDNSGLVSCTPSGIMEIFKSEDIELTGKNIVVVGKSNIVGKPTSNLLINAGATVINCNSKTKNLESFTRLADIVIVATGVPGLLKPSMIKHSAIVIDVGFSVIDGKIYGDAETKNIDLIGAKITPVPGGVGALTVACLMKNTIRVAGIK